LPEVPGAGFQRKHYPNEGRRITNMAAKKKAPAKKAKKTTKKK